MKNQMVPGIPLAVVLLAAVAAVALRAAARRPGPAVMAGPHDRAGPGMPRPQGLPGRSASAAEQMRQVFHELHADGRNDLCAVCDGQYGSA